MEEHYIKAAGIGAYVCALREAERSGATIEKYARELRRFGVWLGGRAVGSVKYFSQNGLQGLA